MTTQVYNRTQNTGFARTLLAITAVLAGIIMFGGVIAFIGGVGGHNLSWLLVGLGLIVVSIVIYMSVRWIIRKVTGSLVTLQSPTTY
jgi:Kef-type K+ transport system membrane component KefB